MTPHYCQWENARTFRLGSQDADEVQFAIIALEINSAGTVYRSANHAITDL